MAAPLRVAQVMGYMNGGGVEQMVMNYYRRVDKTRIQFDLIVCEGSTMPPIREIRENGGRIFMVPPYINLAAYYKTLLVLFRREGWSIVHSHMNALSLIPLGAAANAGIPVRIAHSHNTAGREEHLKNMVKGLLKTQANRYPTHRLACSQAAGEWLFGKDACFDVVPNAVDLERFMSSRLFRQKAREEFGIGQSEFVVGHVGRFMPQKNHNFLLEIFSCLVKSRPMSRLLLVGEGELKEKTRVEADRLGIGDKVLFLGQRKDVERVYGACDAFCLPSLYEGLGIVAIEAQAASLPCLLSDTVPSEVDVGGDCRFLPIDDPRPWVSELVKIEVGAEAPASMSALEDYDISFAAPKLVSRYESYQRSVEFG